MDDHVFVLLDDCDATAQQPTSRLYSGFVCERICTDPHTLDSFWQQIEDDQKSGLHAALFADYEWGSKLQNAGLARIPQNDTSALRVLLFKHLELLSSEAVVQWLSARDGGSSPTPAGVRSLYSDTDYPAFERNISRIRDWITRGETYQVNHTVRLQGTQYGAPLALYRRLRLAQPVPYGVLARLPASAPAGTHWVLSRSPELFVRNTHGRLTTRPMKGTASRLEDKEADRQQADWLQKDAKNRAENVMIVDLLRNDLGRISEIGTVQVPALFTIETYATVHQMTSTVESHLRPDVRFPDVLRALFPCGSITGAPKMHTMGLIAGIETSPRGLYCGAIGWIDAPAPHKTAGDFCMSVAIRTLTLGAETATGRPATLGVGSGVVMDSDAQDEFAETQTKARFVTSMDPGFTLFETMRITNGKVRHLAHHMRRLTQSAQTLGFQCDERDVRHSLAQMLAKLQDAQSYRVRLDLGHDGSTNLQHAALSPLAVGPAQLVLSNAPVPRAEAALLNHKTSMRGSYDAAIQKAIAHGAFDAIFMNAAGEVSEGARSTLLVRVDGRWRTPPLASGVLAGVLRSRLLQRSKHVTEYAMSLDTVLNAEAMLICSALRGLQRAQWLKDADGNVVRV